MSTPIYLVVSQYNPETNVCFNKDEVSVSLNRRMERFNALAKRNSSGILEREYAFLRNSWSRVRVIKTTLEFISGEYTLEDITKYGVMYTNGRDKPCYTLRTTHYWGFDKEMKIESEKKDAVFNKALRDNSKDVTTDFIVQTDEKVVVGYKITAKVTKRGLKSYGKTVTVYDDRIKKPIDLENMRNDLQRVTVSVPNWGTITMSPDSLSDFKTSPVESTITSYTLK